MLAAHNEDPAGWGDLKQPLDAASGFRTGAYKGNAHKTEWGG